jgi:hypothetical protein
MTEAEIARLTRERDEAREALADAGTLMGRTIAMSYCTSAEMPEKDHTHALPSAMLRVIRERDEARERAAGLSRELLDAMQARDSYRMRADLRVGMRREIEEILGVRDTMGNDAFERELARLRGLVAAESRAERLEEALRAIVEDECHQTTRDVGAHLDTCSEERPGDNSRWCAVCIARAALGEEGK